MAGQAPGGSASSAARHAERGAVLRRVERCFETAIQQLQSESAAVENGTHAELLVRCRGLKRKRDESKRDAVRNLQSRHQLVEQLLEHEVAHLDKSFRACVNKVKERMLQELNHRAKALENRRDGVAEEPRMNTRSLRSKTKGEPDDAEIADVASHNPMGAVLLGLGQQAKQRRKITSPASALLDKLLDDDQIHQDLYDINREELQHAEAKPREINVQLNIKAGQLRCDNELFCKGDHVTAWILDGNRQQTGVCGVVQSINNTEVHLKLADGTKHRVYLSHLRNGRAVLSPGAASSAQLGP